MVSNRQVAAMSLAEQPARRSSSWCVPQHCTGALADQNYPLKWARATLMGEVGVWLTWLQPVAAAAVNQLVASPGTLGAQATRHAAMHPSLTPAPASAALKHSSTATAERICISAAERAARRACDAAVNDGCVPRLRPAMCTLAYMYAAGSWHDLT